MKLRKHHITAESDRLSTGQKIAYGLGGIVPIALGNIVLQLMGIVGNIGYGINALLLAVFMNIPRLWDAFSDPMMGYISDNTRSRHGRRLPYILWGGIAVCITFVVMWWIPKGADASIWLQLLYILFLLMLFYTAVTVFEIPHGALGMEMTADYHERTRLFSVKSFVGNMGAMATPWLYSLAQLELFKGAGGNETDGMRYVSIIVALVILPCILICYFVCREGKLKQVSHQARVPFRQNVGTTFKNKTFILLIAIIFMVIMGFNLVGNFANYITIFFLYAGDKVAAAKLMGITGTVWALTSLAAIPPMNWISSRVGKTSTMLISISLMAGAQFIKIWCYSPEHPYLMLIPTAMLSAGMVMYFTLASAMVADVCDEDELHTGNRNEGAYYSVFWWFMKLGMAFAGIAAGALLMVSHFDDEQSSLVDAASSPMRQMVSTIKKTDSLPSTRVIGEKLGKTREELRNMIAHFEVKQASAGKDAAHYAKLIERSHRLKVRRQELQAMEYPRQEEFMEMAQTFIGETRLVARQSPATLLRLRIFEIGIPILLCILSFILMRLYPLSEDRAYEIKDELERRRQMAKQE